MLQAGKETAEDIKQRYYARNAKSAVLIAHIIERKLTNALSRAYKKKDEPVGIAAINTPYDAQIGIIPMMRKGELPSALQKGDTLNSLVGLFGAPLDDVDGDDVPVEVSTTGLTSFRILIPKSHVKQVDNSVEDLAVTIGRWIQTSIKKVRKLFDAKE